MNHSLNYTSLLIAGMLAFSSCRKDKIEDPVPPTVNEEELITTLNLHFHSAGGVEHKHFEFQDLDGAGGAPPLIEADTLSADSVYEVHLQLLNESVSPVVDISVEIQAEAEDHQFFFQASGADIVFTYGDVDANGNPVGLESIWAVGASGSGSLTVTLRHQPDKSATGVNAGDITNAGGETDIEVTFPLVVE